MAAKTELSSSNMELGGLRHRGRLAALPAPDHAAAAGSRDLADEERARWGQPPIPRPELR
jgi:hypothetical protein